MKRRGAVGDASAKHARNDTAPSSTKGLPRFCKMKPRVAPVSASGRRHRTCRVVTGGGVMATGGSNVVVTVIY
eukprot:3109914-Pyramimonas_sp.AAC.1